VGLDPTRRGPFLDRACGDDSNLRAAVDDLLAGHAEADQDRFLDSPSTTGPETSPSADGLNGRIGPYVLQRMIGAGGMGVVFEAARVDEYHQTVAIKLIRHDHLADEIVERFRGERQVLAGLEHPNIARLLDGG